MEGKLASIKEGIGELFTFSQGGFNDLETGDVGEEIAHGLVWIGRFVGVTVMATVAVLTIDAIAIDGIHSVESFADSLLYLLKCNGRKSTSMTVRYEHVEIVSELDKFTPLPRQGFPSTEYVP